MFDEMGLFRTEVEVENLTRGGTRASFSSVIVDTGSELSWFPGDVLKSIGIERFKSMRFRQANGTVLERWTGAAIVHAGGTATVDQVVFGEPNDMILLGARTLEGLNLAVDPVLKRLVDTGPAPAAVSA